MINQILPSSSSNKLKSILQDDLIARGVCSEEIAQKVVNEKCLPVVGERQIYFEKMLETMDVSKNINYCNDETIYTKEVHLRTKIICQVAIVVS